MIIKINILRLLIINSKISGKCINCSNQNQKANCLIENY